VRSCRCINVVVLEPDDDVPVAAASFAVVRSPEDDLFGLKDIVHMVGSASCAPSIGC